MPDLERCVFRSGLKLSGISESATGRKKVFCHIEVGTWIPMSGKVTEETAFCVRAFEPNHWMLWEKAASTWAWKLIPIDEEYTRLIIRLKCHYGWTRPTIVSDLILMELGDFPMMRKMMLGIKQRAERAHEA